MARGGLGLPWVERGRRITGLPDGADADKESWDGTERVVMISRNSALYRLERRVKAAIPVGSALPESIRQDQLSASTIGTM